MLIAYRLYMNTLEGQKTLGYFMSREAAEQELTAQAEKYAGYNVDVEQIDIQS